MYETKDAGAPARGSARYRVEVRKTRRSKWFDSSAYPELAYKRTGKRAARWEGLLDPDRLRALRREARRLRLEVRATPVEYTRSSTYRRDYFDAAGRGAKRCRYCNARLGEGEVTVDHLVAVNLAAKSLLARAALRLMGANGVNDPVNLVPACDRCNRRKAAKGGLWILRGLLGRYRAYWVVLYALAAAALAASVAAAVWQIASIAGS